MVEDQDRASGAVSMIRATGWNTALKRLPKVESRAFRLRGDLPRTVKLQFTPPSIRVRKFAFHYATADLPMPGGSPPHHRQAKPASNSVERPKVTHIRPPSDIIKVDDRLYYLLQPPLEQLLGGGALRMPFRPFPYQLTGVSFLFPRHAAILADEMGLGKTMQAITAIRLLIHAGEIRNVLLVCPKPLVTNWRREFEMWAPELLVTVVEGDQARRRWQWSLTDVPIKLANYELLVRDREEITDPSKHYDLVVLDEAQRIKNRSSTSSQVIRSVPRTRNWALTGTPVENSTEDLVGIFEFLVAGSLSVEMTPRRLREATRDYILRRTKDQVLTDLPPKLYRDALLWLSPEQAEAYERAENEGVVQLNRLGHAITIQHVFELVLRLKQICNFDPQTGCSSKLDRLEADLEEVASSGKKAIVFSQWVHTLEELGDRLDRFGTIAYHGKIPQRQRERAIEQFRSDRSRHVILMSYGAGSVGLNLQFCEYVFLFDRWWNPAVEDQAINRAHRIGAAGPVTVTRFLTSGTIEERIDQVLAQKRELFEAILADAHSPRTCGLSQAEIFGLFDLQLPTGRLDVSSDAA